MDTRPRKKSCRYVEPGCEVSLLLEVTGEVVSNTQDGEECEIKLCQVRIKNHYSSLVSGKQEEKTGEAFIEAEGDVSLIFFGGASQRITCTGLSGDERQTIANASTTELADALGNKPEDEKASLVKSILQSLSEEEREKIFTAEALPTELLEN